MKLEKAFPCWYFQQLPHVKDLGKISKCMNLEDDQALKWKNKMLKATGAYSLFWAGCCWTSAPVSRPFWWWPWIWSRSVSWPGIRSWPRFSNWPWPWSRARAIRSRPWGVLAAWSRIWSAPAIRWGPVEQWSLSILNLVCKFMHNIGLRVSATFLLYTQETFKVFKYTPRCLMCIPRVQRCAVKWIMWKRS